MVAVAILGVFDDAHRSFQTEADDRFRGHPYGPSPRCHLRSRSHRGSRSSSDRRAFSAACDRTDNAADHRAATQVFPGPLVLSDAVLFIPAVLNHVLRIDDVTAS